MNFEQLLQREMIAQGDKTMKRPHRSFEENMQTRCIQWFDARWPRLKLYLHHSPNGGARSKREGAKFKGMGTRAGFPDLIWTIPVRDNVGYIPFVGIEFKYDKGRQESCQIDYENAFKAVGAEYYIIRNDLRFKELMVMLIEKAVLAASIELTKEEAQATKEAHREIKVLRTIQLKEQAIRDAEKAKKCTRKK